MLQHRIVCEIWLPVSALCVVLITVFCKRDRKKKINRGSRLVWKPSRDLIVRNTFGQHEPRSVEKMTLAQKLLIYSSGLPSLNENHCGCWYKSTAAEITRGSAGRRGSRCSFASFALHAMQRLQEKLCNTPIEKTVHSLTWTWAEREKFCFFFAGDRLLFLNDRIQ